MLGLPLFSNTDPTMSFYSQNSAEDVLKPAELRVSWPRSVAVIMAPLFFNQYSQSLASHHTLIPTANPQNPLASALFETTLTHFFAAAHHGSRNYSSYPIKKPLVDEKNMSWNDEQLSLLQSSLSASIQGSKSYAWEWEIGSFEYTDADGEKQSTEIKDNLYLEGRHSEELKDQFDQLTHIGTLFGLPMDLTFVHGNQQEDYFSHTRPISKPSELQALKDLQSHQVSASTPSKSPASWMNLGQSHQRQTEEPTTSLAELLLNMDEHLTMAELRAHYEAELLEKEAPSTVDASYSSFFKLWEGLDGAKHPLLQKKHTEKYMLDRSEPSLDPVTPVSDPALEPQTALSKINPNLSLASFVQSYPEVEEPLHTLFNLQTFLWGFASIETALGSTHWGSPLESTRFKDTLRWASDRSFFEAKSPQGWSIFKTLLFKGEKTLRYAEQVLTALCNVATVDQQIELLSDYAQFYTQRISSAQTLYRDLSQPLLEGLCKAVDQGYHAPWPESINQMLARPPAKTDFRKGKALPGEDQALFEAMILKVQTLEIKKQKMRMQSDSSLQEHASESKVPTLRL